MVEIGFRAVQDESQLDMGMMIIVELVVNTHDAMGANVVNTMCEAVGQAIESITGCRTILKILSNYSVRRLVRCISYLPKKSNWWIHCGTNPIRLCSCLFRCIQIVTHNKGIMNGIDAVALATGQDFRAIEAAAHAYASREGHRSLSKWSRDENGDLVGELEMPMAVGTVGGVTKYIRWPA